MLNVEWAFRSFNIQHLTFNIPVLRHKLLDDGDHVPERLHPPRLVIGNRDAELLFDGEEDGERVERVDPGVRERRVEGELVVGDRFLLTHDGDQLLRDLVACHDGGYDSNACDGVSGFSTRRGLRFVPSSRSRCAAVKTPRAAATAFSATTPRSAPWPSSATPIAPGGAATRPSTSPGPGGGREGRRRGGSCSATVCHTPRSSRRWWWSSTGGMGGCCGFESR